MAERPHYGQYCPLSMAAEIIGTRWTLLILRELLGKHPVCTAGVPSFRLRG
jgi:DNA-binding HxlR family transcriptional regulator